MADNDTDDQVQVLLTGWAAKEGGLIKSWRTRFFVLRNRLPSDDLSNWQGPQSSQPSEESLKSATHFLCYYKTTAQARSDKHGPTGVIPIAKDLTTTTKTTKPNGRKCLEISTPGYPRAFYIEPQDSIDGWVEILSTLTQISTGAEERRRTLASRPAIVSAEMMDEDDDTFRERKLKQLLPKVIDSEGDEEIRGPPSQVQDWIDGNIELALTPECTQYCLQATIWCLDAIKYGHIDKRIKAEFIKLLTTVPFSLNLETFETINADGSRQTAFAMFRSGLFDMLSELSIELKERYERLDLGSALGETVIDEITEYHSISQSKSKAKSSMPLTQLDVLPKLSSKLESGSLFPERVYLQAMLMVAKATDSIFQNRVLQIAESVGIDADAVKNAPTKAYMRALNKMYSRDDHRNNPKPRCAYNIDLVRNLVMVSSPDQLKDFYTAAQRKFGGVGKVKNLYALPDKQRDDRFNLVSLMVTWIVDSELTYGDLCKRPEVQEMWKDYAEIPRGEPKGRWKLLCDLAQKHLESSALAKKRVHILGETQILLAEDAAVRHQMHSPYKAYRAVDPTQLFQDYFQSAAASGAVRGEKLPDPDEEPESLIVACFAQRVDAVEKFLKDGADPSELRDKDQLSPIIAASMVGNVEVGKLLLDYKADPDQIVRRAGHPIDGRSALFNAATSGHLDFVELLLDRKANPDLGSAVGDTPLNTVCSSGHLEIAELLLQKNANINLSRNDNTSPVQTAARYGHLDIVELLAAKGADLSIKDVNGMGPIYMAALKKHSDVVRSLLTHNANPNDAQNNMESPLFCAAFNGDIATAKALLDYNVNVNMPTINGTTPIAVAAEYGQFEMVELLLNANADTSIRNVANMTPLAYSVQKKHNDIAVLLQKFNATM